MAIQKEIFSASHSATSPPDTILFHRNLSSEQIASLAPSLSLHKGWAIDCDSVPACTGWFLKRRDRWEHNCYLVGSNWGRGAGTNNSVAEKSWHCFWSICWLQGAPSWGGGQAKLLPGEKAVIPMEVVLHLRSHLWELESCRQGERMSEGFVSRKEHLYLEWRVGGNSAMALQVNFSSKVHVHCNHRK